MECNEIASTSPLQLNIWNGSSYAQGTVGFNYILTVLKLVFSNLRFENGSSNWLNAKLTCKLWCFVGNQIFTPTICNNYALRWAIEHNNANQIITLLKDPRVDWLWQENYLLRWAAEMGHIKLLQILLQNPLVDPSANKNSAIERAAAKGHSQIVRILLSDKRVDPSSHENIALRWAALNGFVEVVQILLKDKRVDPSSNNHCALRWSIHNAKWDVALILKSQIYDRQKHLYPALTQNIEL
jgi:hypothetical protein